MSGVTLRCPNCGTTQSGTGECDACHEAAVRYFCAYHNPGRWLDGPACPNCGARFGEVRPAPRVTSAPPSAPPPGRVAPPTPGPGSGSPRIGTASPSRPEAPFDPRMKPPVRPIPSPWLRRAPSPSEPRPTDPDLVGEDADPFRRRWPDVLRSRMRRGYGAEAGELRSPLQGCRRVALLGVILIVVLFAMGLFSAGPFLQILLQILLSQ